MNPSPINLSENSQIIGQGLYCTCYLHPEDDTLCIKVPTSHKKAAKRQRTDGAYYLRLRQKEVDLTHIPAYFGMCETTLGTGHLYQRISDPDGQTSKTLNHYFRNDSNQTTELIDRLVKLKHYLLANCILIGDLHGNNVVVQILEKNDFELMIVDGIGDRVLFTAPNIFSAVKKGKITRRWNRFMRRLQSDHPQISFPAQDLHIQRNHHPGPSPRTTTSR